MMSVLRDYGFHVDSELRDGVYHLTIPIARSRRVERKEAERERLSTVASMRNVMAPRSIAVVGASRQPGSIGQLVFQNIMEGGFSGVVYPVNPKADAIMAVKAYPSILDVPGEVDLAKYPFTSEASEYVSRVGLEVHELGDPDYSEITKRAVERVKEAIVRGRVSWKGEKRSDIEIFSYPVALFFVSTIRDGFLTRRYVLAEAERAYGLLQKEGEATLIDIASHAFGWKTRILPRDAGGPSGFIVHFIHYLKNSTVLTMTNGNS